MRHSQIGQANIIVYMTIGVALRCAFVGIIVGLLYVLNYSLNAEILTQQEIFLIPILIGGGALNGLQLGALVGLVIGIAIKWMLHRSSHQNGSSHNLHTIYKTIIGFTGVLVVAVIVGVVAFNAIDLLPWSILLIAIITSIILQTAHRYVKEAR